jgi:uncharacterized protein with FMN-binding domain
MNEHSQTNKRKIQAGLALVALSTVIIVTAVATSSTNSMSMKTASATSPTTTTTQAATSTPTTAATAGSTYKDGTYSATGSYFSPGGQESIKVNVTLKNDIVTASSAVSGANDPTAQVYQMSFINGYKIYVIGKDISSIKLSNVSGSSLTSQGFNNALKQIEQHATA